MSLGGLLNKAVNKAVEKAIKMGVRVVTAAGNSNSNACRYSPASAKGAITVGSTTQSDFRSSFSNTGKCVNILAPGSNVKGAWIGKKTATKTISGTSMAAPLVSGVLAQVLQENKCQRGSEERIIGSALRDAIKNVPNDTPNLLLHIRESGNVTCVEECSSIKDGCRCKLNNEINSCFCKWKGRRRRKRCVIAV